jgi:hypothetical protein
MILLMIHMTIEIPEAAPGFPKEMKNLHRVSQRTTELLRRLSVQLCAFSGFGFAELATARFLCVSFLFFGILSCWFISSSVK